jgi:sugar/nucleoside kinase (ribokinase family)
MILVVGSANVDTFLPVSRLPVEGENVMTMTSDDDEDGMQNPVSVVVDVPGGKGLTQAIACSRLLDCRIHEVEKDHDEDDATQLPAAATTTRVSFWGQIGDDRGGSIIQQALDKNNVRYKDLCGINKRQLTGRGYVFLVPNTGSVSAIVSGGTNMHGWTGWKNAWNRRRSGRNQHQQQQQDARGENSKLDQLASTSIEEKIRMQLRHDEVEGSIDYIMLQCEVPEYVNLLIADIAKHDLPPVREITIVLDAGGEDRPISSKLLQLCDFVIPNETELLRLVKNEEGTFDTAECSSDDENDDVIIDAMKKLQRQGASNVLVTRGSKGSILLTADGQLIHQPAIPVHGGTAVDETGAGDCYRAAFCVALMEGHDLKDCMKFASAAGSCAVEVHGAVPSAPTRSRVLNRLSDDTVLTMPRGGNSESTHDPDKDFFPFLIGSRLNSMKDRPELWQEQPLSTPKDYVRRQSQIKGLTCVDFNYPQHFQSYWSPEEAREALDEAGLRAGAVCLRYPSKFARGAMNNPDPSLRSEAIQLTKEAAQAATILGCDEVVVWSAFDGCEYLLP